MKFAAAMTLYNPDQEIIENLKRIARLFEKLYVNDNTNYNLEYVEEIKEIKNIVYLWNGHNDGLAIAFNRMLDLAYMDKIDFLCTLDQDSILTRSNVNKVESYIECHDMSQNAVVAPFPTGTRYRGRKDVEEVEWVICSGCFLNLELLENNKIKYDDAYFIDRFDADICMQIRRKGLKIIRMNEVVFKHRCGDEEGSHSELRHYYMFRNRYYYNNKYYTHPVSAIRTFLQNLRHFRWIYSDKKKIDLRKKIFVIARKDYKEGRLGKITKETLDIICEKCN